MLFCTTIHIKFALKLWLEVKLLVQNLLVCTVVCKNLCVTTINHLDKNNTKQQRGLVDMEQPKWWQTTTKSTEFKRTLLSPVQSKTKPSKYKFNFVYFPVGYKYSVMKDMVMHCKTKLFKIKKISSFG